MFKHMFERSFVAKGGNAKHTCRLIHMSDDMLGLFLVTPRLNETGEQSQARTPSHADKIMRVGPNAPARSWMLICMLLDQCFCTFTLNGSAT